MLLINFFGAPGAGKSTASAYIFSKLKMAGVNAEYVPEFAKDKVWEENETALKNQVYIFGKQFYRITRCENNVDVIVCDSPLINSIVYNHDERLGKIFNDLILQVSNSYDSMNYLIKRVKPYNPKGRIQTEEESDELAVGIKNLLDKYNVKYREYNGDIVSYDKIVEEIKEKIFSSKTWQFL